MSDRAACEILLNRLPDFKIGYVLAYLQGLCADEEADDAYCESLYHAYQKDSSSDKHETVSLERLASDLGVSL